MVPKLIKSVVNTTANSFIFIPLIFIIIGVLIGPSIFPLLFSNLAFYPYGILALLLAFFSQPKRIWVLLMTLQHKIKITALLSFISVILGAATSIFLVVVLKLGAVGKILGVFPAVVIYFILSFNTIKRYTEGLWSIESIKKQKT